MLRNIKLLALLLLTLPAFGNVVTSITITPPTQGYYVPATSSTVQLGATCTYTSGPPDACVGHTLTWQSTNTTIMTTTSGGLQTVGPRVSQNISTLGVASGVLTVTGTNQFVNDDVVWLEGLTANPSLNNTAYTVTSATGSQWTASTISGNITTGAETGVTRYNNAAITIMAYEDRSATITHCAVSGTTATLTATNDFQPGQIVLLTGLTACSFMNNQPFIVATANSTQFTGYFPHSTVNSADSGTGQVSVLGNADVLIGSYPITAINFEANENMPPNLALNSPVLVPTFDNRSQPTTLYGTWTSSNTAIATTTTVGEVDCIATGAVNITINVGGTTATTSTTCTSITPTVTEYFVRPNGGTRWSAAVTSGQCNGLADVDYPGSGTDQACAFNNPMYCSTDESSGSVYTGAVQGGDICTIHPAPGLGYPIARKADGTPWVPHAIGIPSGTTAHKTTYRGSNWASCSTDPHHVGNRANMYTQGGHDFTGFSINQAQNIDIQCIDVSSGNDCNQGIDDGVIEFACPYGNGPLGIYVDDFTSNFTMENVRSHGFALGVGGTPGPGVVFDHVSVENNYQTGLNFDGIFGHAGLIADGFTQTNSWGFFNGCTEEQPKTVTSVSRDGAGNLTVVFPNSQEVNYAVGTNLVLTGMTPSDLNGTFTVTSVTFNQQTVNITGGNVSPLGGHEGLPFWQATFNTSAPPAFGIGAFVKISGVSPSYINNGGTNDPFGGYEVIGVSSSGFTVTINQSTRPNWVSAGPSGGPISSGGTASTATTVVASAVGGSETASVVGTGGHVYQQHRCIDEGAGNGGGNGDCIGTGGNTIGSWNTYNSECVENTQDGWDMVHSAITNTQVQGFYAEGNMGATIKFGNLKNGTIQNSEFVGNAPRMMAFDPNKPPDFNQYLSDFFRGGDTIAINNREYANVNISNNTFLTTYGVMIDTGCLDADCTALSPPHNSFWWQNNQTSGYLDLNPARPSAQLPRTLCDPSCNGSPNTGANWVWINNIGFNMLSGSNPATGWVTTNPLIVQTIPSITTWAAEPNSFVFNNNLQSGSPAIGAGATNSLNPTLDFNGATRPVPPAIGAFELGGTPVAGTPSFSPGAGTYTGTQNVTISASSGGVICYNFTGAPSTNGTTGCTAGTLYTGPVAVTVSGTLYAVAGGTGFLDSSVASAGYTINGVATSLTIPSGWHVPSGWKF